MQYTFLRTFRKRLAVMLKRSRNDVDLVAVKIEHRLRGTRLVYDHGGKYVTVAAYDLFRLGKLRMRILKLFKSVIEEYERP